MKSAQRAQNLPPLFFDQVNKRVAALQAAGADIIKLDAGSPDLPPDDRLIETLKRSANDPTKHNYGGYAGQIPWFEWRLLGEKPMLASMHGRRLPPEPCKGDGGMTFCEPWEMRPSVYVIEGKPLMQNYAFSKRVIYVDKETNLIPTSDLYDANGELWKNVQISFRADSRDAVDAFYALAIQNGGTDNGPPGLRPQYTPTYYAAFVIDPDGYRIEAVTFTPD